MMKRGLSEEKFDELVAQARITLGDAMVDRVMASANRLFAEPEDVVRASIAVAFAILMMPRGQPRTIQ